MGSQAAAPCVQPVVDDGDGVHLREFWDFQETVIFASQQLKESTIMAGDEVVR